MDGQIIALSPMKFENEGRLNRATVIHLSAGNLSFPGPEEAGLASRPRVAVRRPSCVLEKMRRAMAIPSAAEQ